jgi:flagellar motor switch protein FliM
MAQAATKSEIASQKKVIKLAPAIGDWTTYRPSKILVKKIKTGLYGFDRLSKAELGQVLLIHYRFTQELLKRFKIDLKMGVEFFGCQVEQTTYLSFLRTLGSPVAQGKIAIADIHDGIQVFFDLSLADSIINHALGSRDLEPLNRGLTEAETAVLSTTFTEYLPAFRQAFENIFADPLFSVVSSPEATFDTSINSASTFIFFSAEVSLGENPAGRIVFGYPAPTLKSLLKIFKEKSQIKTINFNRLPAPVLNKIVVNLSALLGKTVLLASELNQLEVGDVVALDSSINSALPLTIGSLFRLLYQPGVRNKKKIVRFAAFREEEIEIIPPQAIAEELPLETPPEESLPPEEKIEEPAAPEEEFPNEEEFLAEEDFELPEEKEESDGS